MQQDQTYRLTLNAWYSNSVTIKKPTWIILHYRHDVVESTANKDGIIIIKIIRCNSSRGILCALHWYSDSGRSRVQRLVGPLGALQKCTQSSRGYHCCFDPRRMFVLCSVIVCCVNRSHAVSSDIFSFPVWLRKASDRSLVSCKLMS